VMGLRHRQVELREDVHRPYSGVCGLHMYCMYCYLVCSFDLCGCSGGLGGLMGLPRPGSPTLPRLGSRTPNLSRAARAPRYEGGREV
jgi:hypothetical protein